VKNGDASISSALNPYSSAVEWPFDGEDEGQRHHRADQVARDHDVLAIEPVERDSGERAGQHRGDGARQQNAAHYQTGVRSLSPPG
jgi:hypothetical protein